VRCAYCDFNTYAGLEGLIPVYTRALCTEINQVGRGAQEAGLGCVEVNTLFLGGGTPSLLPVEQVEAILEAVRTAFDVQADAEISLEANPGTVDVGQLIALRALGVNRLSFGVQSAQEDELQLLDRLHTFAQAADAVA
jgi:oxygen-independent coproporphyrinogen-3 oxidase